MSISGLDNYVTLDELTHTYTDKDGRNYLSATKFIGRFYKPFDANEVAGYVAKSEGVTRQEILDRWNAQTERGTIIHKAIERFNKTTIILPEDEIHRPLILNIASQYTNYYRMYDEQILYDTDTMIAGTADRPCVCTSSSKSVIDILDWKNYGRGINQKEIDKYGNFRNEYMLHVLSHLQNSSYNKVALQLSLYAYMLQKKTGRKIGKLFAHWINPENTLINYQIPIPYLKYEIIEMLEWHKQNPIVEHESIISL